MLVVSKAPKIDEDCDVLICSFGTTQFASSVSETSFVPPISLQEGLARTLRYEFLEDNSDKRTFDTE